MLASRLRVPLITALALALALRSNQSLADPHEDTRIARRISVQFIVNGKPMKRPAWCVGAEPRVKIRRGRKFVLMSFEAAIKKASRSGQKKKSKILSAQADAAALLCLTEAPPPDTTPPPDGMPGDSPPVPGPLPPSLPPAQALEPFTGTFGHREAHILYSRFAFGATPDELDAAVARGLEATVNHLLTYVEEPHLESQVQDLACDDYLSVNPITGVPEPENRSCNPNDPNDISPYGISSGLTWRFIKTKNPYFAKLLLFLHDERMAASIQGIDWAARYAAREHVEMLLRAARSGDYKQYMHDWLSDLLGNLLWLDGCSNTRFGPNENFAREFWELGTTGTRDRAGNPVYSSLDIANAALAHTGWQCAYLRVPTADPQDYRYLMHPVYVSEFHEPGIKTIFRGSPWEAQIENSEELLEATFRHPRTAEHMAEDLCREFLSPECAHETIASLAYQIQASQFDLHAAMRTMMLSALLYHESNDRSLIKHPLELAVGFLRATEIPVEPSRLRWGITERLGQQPLEPPTVFGWNEVQLAGDARVLDWRNVLLEHMQWTDWAEIRTRSGYDVLSHFQGTASGGMSLARATVSKLSALLHVPLNEAQRTELERFLSKDLALCEEQWEVRSYGCRLGEDYYREADYSNDESSIHRTLMAAAMLMMLPEYRLK